MALHKVRCALGLNDSRLLPSCTLGSWLSRSARSVPPTARREGPSKNTSTRLRRSLSSRASLRSDDAGGNVAPNTSVAESSYAQSMRSGRRSAEVSSADHSSGVSSTVASGCPHCALTCCICDACDGASTPSVLPSLPLELVLPSREVGPQTDLESSRICSICFEGYDKDEDRVFLPCCHSFHDHCVSPWIGRRNTCPTCRLPANGCFLTDFEVYSDTSSNQSG